ncbi:hypothetical protein BBJ28_00017198 [Nothophytophthora sp. Chile5]|nr:hypothetical protein BBJ28_00017198 [Nothophytophthora sp. Chile5]
MSSYERDPPIGADAGAEQPGGSLATPAAATTTTAAQAATAANSGSSSAGGSPDSLTDDARAQGAGSRQPSPSSDGSSPMRRLPSVLRPPPASAAASLSSTQPQPTAARPQTQPQAQRVSRSPQRPLTQSAGPTTSAAVNRDLMGRRHLFQPPTQAVSAALPQMQMQPQYFMSNNAGRLTTGNTSGYRHHLSPVSSPPMGGEAWPSPSQNAMNAAVGGSGRGLKRHLQPPFDSYARGDGYLARTTSGGVGPSSRMVRQMPSSAAPQQQQQQMASGHAAAKPPSTGMTQQTATTSSMRPSNSVGGSTTTTTTSPSASGNNLVRVRQLPQHMQQQSMGYGTPPHEDPLQYEPSGEARHPRDAARYETWTSKQLRKKCSHLKLRGLKNVKKHVMVEALYRYYRTQRLRDIVDASPSNAARNGENKQADAQYKEVPVTSEDVIRLVDVVLSAEFVDRLAAEISRWQFWVDIREMYIALLQRQHVGESTGSTSGTGSSGSATNSRNFKWSSMQLWEIWKELSFAYTKTCFEFTAAGMKSEHTLYIASVLLGGGSDFSSGELAVPAIDGDGREAATCDPQWLETEELTDCAVACVACVRFVAGVDERDYINFCDDRPDVYYLHQRLHARPDLLHLIKSNEYIDEKCTSEASESISLEQQQQQQQQQSGGGATSPMMRAHKRYKRSGPMVGPAAGGYGGSRLAVYRGTSNAAGGAGAGVGAGAPNAGGGANASSGQGSGDSQGNSPNAQEDSTENSETTGEEGSSNTANSHASNSSVDVSLRTALAEQKYFGLLLQNFEVIFESLHNKKVLLAALRKDSKAPDHLVADLHDDIHVLSALKKDFRNKLRRTMQ